MTKQQVLIERTNGSVVATAMTDQAGHFTSILAPGNYLLSVRGTTSSIIGRQQATFVALTGGQTTSVQIIIDSGMR